MNCYPPIPSTTQLARATLLLSTVAMFSCGGGGGSSPTAPEEVLFLTAAGAMQNQGDRCCLEQVGVSLDGAALETFSLPQGGGVVAWNVNIGPSGQIRAVPIRRGAHDLHVAVARDPAAPSSYWATGEIAIKDLQDNIVFQMQLNRKDGSLDEGQGLSWSFSF